MPIAEYGESAHGVTVSVEKTDVPGAEGILAAGVFVTVGGLNSGIDLEWTREWTETTPHSKTVDGGVTSNVIKRGEMALEVNYVHGVTEYDDILRDHFMYNRTFGLMMRGPGGSAGVDEVIQSGELLSWSLMQPVNAGERKAKCTFRPSGPFKMDGDIYD